MKFQKTMLLGLLIFVMACTPQEHIVTIDGTEGCSLIHEYESIVTPAIEQDCTLRCQEIGYSYTNWRCSEQDLLECLCK